MRAVSEASGERCGGCPRWKICQGRSGSPLMRGFAAGVGSKTDIDAAALT